ncbi:cytosolic leucyl tRNA synthetase [Elasticomyces elasticus]|nr:cytosolic leucyl tRNA synthetase [Elasticomyces elasticus]
MALQLGNTHNRDVLIAIEQKYQQEWQDDKVFESEPPNDDSDLSPAELREKHPKYFGTFAYPYMNGSGHAGHLFTVSKVEFTIGFNRLDGKNTLFPLGFHCTGMPIKAASDKLISDIKRFGQNFEKYSEDEETPSKPNGATIAPVQAMNKKEDITKFSSNKSKATNKNLKTNYQFQSMLAMGIPKEEIHKFADPEYWLEYFPPIWKKDMISLGARIDWRRQFVTTNANPYYDAFVRWQMNRLKELNKILYGKRYTVYSPKDGQPCMDHDRTKGEGVGPTEYTALKLKVKEWSPEAAQAVEGTFFNIDNFPKDQSELISVAELAGSAFIGTLVVAPLSVYTEGIRILPMETVLATKGTGVVTCVPSDSPDDFATVRELTKKADYYKIKKEWVDLEVVPVLDTPAYGNLTAKHLVEKMKINSPKDDKQLAEAKDLAYKEGFYNGTMLIGDYKGEKVQDAKDKVRQQILKSGEGFPYADPSAEVISRSADECVVAYIPQWFLNYGENDKEWQQSVMDYVKDGLNTYTNETQNSFISNLEWLNQWACARTYGLGSRLPWDQQFLVESLSDSTVYMAYYTISHFLHGEKFGQQPGLLNIKEEQMTDEVWDYVFCRTSDIKMPADKSSIPEDKLTTMRKSFQYWYPLDLRSSGKDLIPNHLTFFLYIHLALFPREYWPRSVRSNGHLLLNGEKMAKSTGNFLTITQAVSKFGADATRVALADAGDGMEDANFEEKGANAAIMRLYTLKAWIEETIADPNLRKDDNEECLWDQLFLDEMHALVHESYNHYAATNYKLALKSCLYDFQSARDFYREQCNASGIAMLLPLIQTYIELQALIISTIAPHWAEYMWLDILHKPSTIQKARWPQVSEPSRALTAQREYIKLTASNITSAEAQAAKRIAKGKGTGFDPKLPKKLTIYIATKFPEWQEKYITLLSEALKNSTINDDKAINGQVAKAAGKDMKKVMPFVQQLRQKILGGDKSAFDRELPFEETPTLKEMIAGLKRTTGCKEIEIVTVEGQSGLPGAAETAIPGKPGFSFENIKE